MNIKGIVSVVTKFITKNSPVILTGVGITGMAGATILAVKASKKAAVQIQARKEELQVEELPKKEVVKTVWKTYAPAVVAFGVGAGCVIGAQSINAKRNALLLASCTGLEATCKNLEKSYDTYKKKVVETVGEEKEKEIHTAAVHERMTDIPTDNNMSDGKEWFFDEVTGRYFRSTMKDIYKAANTLTRKLFANNEHYATINELYDELDVERAPAFDTMGWLQGYDEIDIFEMDPKIAPDGSLCRVISYNWKVLWDHYENSYGRY